jgi:LuxR family maltose regulon positive regulatory protein
LRDHDRHEIPAPPARLVDRPRLLRQLDQIADHVVTVISAPAGTGKSTLLAEWCRRRSTEPVTWVTVTDRAQFDGIQADTDRVVVVDGIDTDELATAALHLATEFERAGGPGRLVLAGRCRLPASVVSLVLRGRVWQLDVRDLLLDAEEAAAVVVAHARRPMSVPDPHGIAARLDGWMVAAVLAGLSHPGGAASVDDAYDAAVDAIEAYVATEVVAGLAPELRRFAVDTACVEELDPALCDAITGRNDSEAMLARLKASGFPLVRSPSDGLRALRPVRESLDAAARRDDPDRRARALRAAADWYSRHQMPFEAAACLIRLDAWMDVIAVVVHHFPQIVARDETVRIAEIVERAPRELLREQTALALAASWVLRMDGRVTASTELLGVYEPYMSPLGRMVADLSRASVASWSDNMAGAVEFAEKALAECERLGPDAFDAVDLPTPLVFGPMNTEVFRVKARDAALLACAYGGMWERAAPHLVDVPPETMLKLPQLQSVITLGHRATYAAMAGRAADAESDARRALAVAGQADLLENRLAADAWFALGESLRLMLRYDDAADALRRARQLAELNGRRNLIASAVAAQAHIAVDVGDPGEALDLVEALHREHSHRFPVTIAGQLAAAEARARIASGRYQAALRLLDMAPLTAPTAMARVAALLGAGDIAGAQGVVRDWPRSPTEDAVVRRALAAAVICDQTGDRRRVGLLRTALDAAARPRLMQPFVELGAPGARLLRQVAVDDSPLARDLQRWLGLTTAAVAPPRFTAREAMVMSHVAEGRKLREVADAIHVSVNTVRTHVQSAYRKLGVDNRADAIRAWRTRDVVAGSGNGRGAPEPGTSR